MSLVNLQCTVAYAQTLGSPVAEKPLKLCLTQCFLMFFDHKQSLFPPTLFPPPKIPTALRIQDLGRWGTTLAILKEKYNIRSWQDVLQHWNKNHDRKRQYISEIISERKKEVGIVRTQKSDGLDSKESACNAGDLNLIPGSGRSSGEGNGNPLQYSHWENPMDRGV